MQGIKENSREKDSEISCAAIDERGEEENEVNYLTISDLRSNRVFVCPKHPPLAFVPLHHLIRQLSSLRIVEKLARPGELAQKELLHRSARLLLEEIHQEMDRIKILSAEFRGHSEAFVEGQCLSSNEWKNQLDAIRTQIHSLFHYSFRFLPHVCRAVGFPTLKFLDLTKWVKDCIHRMKTL